jgi:hypothetical protein
MQLSSIPGMYNETQQQTVHYALLLTALHIRSLQFVQAYDANFTIMIHVVHYSTVADHISCSHISSSLPLKYVHCMHST